MFFEDYPQFLESSETSKDPVRLSARYEGLIVSNRGLFQNATVLDLASHDGRWSFAALKNGASFVLGIEWKNRLVKKAMDNMATYNAEWGRYRFVTGDMFDEIDRIDRRIDCIFCFGIFYHIDSHMLLLDKLSRLEAKHIIIDTNISQIRRPVIELKTEPHGTRLVGHPSREGVEAMLSSFGWQVREFDWNASGLISDIDFRSYRSGRRITMIGSR